MSIVFNILYSNSHPFLGLKSTNKTATSCCPSPHSGMWAELCRSYIDEAEGMKKPRGGSSRGRPARYVVSRCCLLQLAIHLTSSMQLPTTTTILTRSPPRTRHREPTKDGPATLIRHVNVRPRRCLSCRINVRHLLMCNSLDPTATHHLDSAW